LPNLGSGGVPRYFLSISDGMRTYTDSRGVELTGILAARETARAIMRELKGLLCERSVRGWSDWKIIVTNDKDKTVFEIDFDLKVTERTRPPPEAA
jgi:hypothetical protein